MAIAGGNLHRPFGVFLALDTAKIDRILVVTSKEVCKIDRKRRLRDFTGKKFHGLIKAFDAVDFQPLDNSSLGRVG